MTADSEDSQPASVDRPTILCTNDDGIHAIGLNTLIEVASRLGRVQVVAPDREQSATSHSLTVHRPLRATRTPEGHHVIDGTPTDCVLIGINQLLDDPPDFVLSGVNHGPNRGEDVRYSGTVAAAMEGTILGLPAIAVSFSSRAADRIPGYADVLHELIGALIRRADFPEETFFNVNLPDIPADELKGTRVTTLGRRVYSDSLTRREDPTGREYFWIGGGVSNWSGRDDSDFRAVQAGYVSVTPLHLDLTNYRLISEVRSWMLGG